MAPSAVSDGGLRLGVRKFALLLIALMVTNAPVVDCVQIHQRDAAHSEGLLTEDHQNNNQQQEEQRTNVMEDVSNTDLPESISLAELKAAQEIDNMSVSEIIQQRFKKKTKINEVKTPEEVAQIIIKGPEEANLKSNVEGDEKIQQEYQTKIADIETNRMYSWSDMQKVKHDLWNKLHSVKTMVKDQVTNLAQVVSAQSLKLYNRMPQHIKTHLANFYAMNMGRKPAAEQPVMLGQVAGTQQQKVNVKVESATEKHSRHVASSSKHANTKGTLLLYFCIMSVLIFCCLGRCLVVPLSQASKFELNSRKHIKKLDKNGFIQQEVIQ